MHLKMMVCIGVSSADDDSLLLGEFARSRASLILIAAAACLSMSHVAPTSAVVLPEAGCITLALPDEMLRASQCLGP